MLSSSYPTVINIANAEVNQPVRLASRSNPTPALNSKYLSSLPNDCLTNLRHNIQSLCTRVRKSTRNLGVEIRFNDKGLLILIPPVLFLLKKPVISFISTFKIVLLPPYLLFLVKEKWAVRLLPTPLPMVLPGSIMA